jgi:Right handed beta helix region
MIDGLNRSFNALFPCGLKTGWLAFVIFLTVLFSHASSGVAGDSIQPVAQALANLGPDQTVLNLPEGVYALDSTLVISRPGITIRGAGRSKTVLIGDRKLNGVLVRMDGENSTLSNLTLDGNGTGTVISLNRPRVTIENIEVKNFTHIGIAVPASGCRITGCLVNGLGTAAAPSMGIWHDAGKAPSESTITIEHSAIRNNGMCGIYCTGGKITIANNAVTRNHLITNVGGGQIDVGNAFSTNTVATITGNTIADGGSDKAGAIEMGGGYFTVTDNTIRNHGSCGIGTGHNVIGANITGNTISNCGRNLAERNQPQCRSAIYVGYGAANVVISGNHCFDDQRSKTQTWGVILAPPPLRADPRFAAKATEHVVVKQNDLRGNLHPEGLLDESGATDRIIVSNLPARAHP